MSDVKIETYFDSNSIWLHPVVNKKFHGTAKEWEIFQFVYTLIAELDYVHGNRHGVCKSWRRDKSFWGIDIWRNDVRQLETEFRLQRKVKDIPVNQTLFNSNQWKQICNQGFLNQGWKDESSLEL